MFKNYYPWNGVEAMPVWLRNLQRAVKLQERLLKLHTCFLLHAAGGGRFDLSVVCVEIAEMRKLNGTYRREHRETDVLAFPYHEVGGGGAQGSTGI